MIRLDDLRVKIAELDELQPHDEWHRGYYQCLQDLERDERMKRLMASWFDRIDDMTWPLRSTIGDAWESTWVRGTLGLVIGVIVGVVVF